MPNVVPLSVESDSEEVELDTSALLYLDQHGFIPGATGVVLEVAPDGTRLVELHGESVAFGRPLAERLFVAVA